MYRPSPNISQADCASALSDLTVDMGRALRASQSVSNIILRLLSGTRDDLGTGTEAPHVSCAVPASFPWQDVLASLPLWGAEEGPGTGWAGVGGFDLDTGDNASDCSEMDMDMHFVTDSESPSRVLSPRSPPGSTPRSVTGSAIGHFTSSISGLSSMFTPVSLSTTCNSPASTASQCASPINDNTPQTHRMKVNLSKNGSDAFSVIISPPEPYSPTSIYGLSTMAQSSKSSNSWLSGWPLQLLGGEASPKVKSPHPHPASPKPPSRKSYSPASSIANSIANSIVNSVANSVCNSPRMLQTKPDTPVSFTSQRVAELMNKTTTTTTPAANSSSSSSSSAPSSLLSASGWGEGQGDSDSMYTGRRSKRSARGSSLGAGKGAGKGVTGGAVLADPRKGCGSRSDSIEASISAVEVEVNRASCGCSSSSGSDGDGDCDGDRDRNADKEVVAERDKVRRRDGGGSIAESVNTSLRSLSIVISDDVKSSQGINNRCNVDCASNTNGNAILSSSDFNSTYSPELESGSGPGSGLGSDLGFGRGDGSGSEGGDFEANTPRRRTGSFFCDETHPSEHIKSLEREEEEEEEEEKKEEPAALKTPGNTGIPERPLPDFTPRSFPDYESDWLQSAAERSGGAATPIRGPDHTLSTRPPLAPNSGSGSAAAAAAALLPTTAMFSPPSSSTFHPILAHHGLISPSPVRRRSDASSFSNTTSSSPCSMAVNAPNTPPHLLQSSSTAFSPAFSPYSSSTHSRSTSSSKSVSPTIPLTLTSSSLSIIAPIHTTISPILTAWSDESRFITMGSEDIRTVRNSSSDDANRLNNGSYDGFKKTEVEVEVEAESEAEAEKILLLPIDSLFEKNKSCQQTLIHFGR